MACTGRFQSALFDRSIFPVVVAILAVIFQVAVVRAQRASDNLVVSAADAFGLTLAPKTIGTYGPGQRGFSPLTAGNVRIDGPHFDQQVSEARPLAEMRE